MPDYKITQFDKAAYERLMTFLDSIGVGINTNPQALGVSAAIKLDNTLATTMRPGSPTWTVAQNFATAAGVFGGSANQQYKLTEAEMRAFVTALNDASDVFEETDDLTTLEASKFTKDHPGIAGPGTTSLT